MKNLFDRMTKDFILNEGNTPAFQMWIQSLQENLNSLRPKTRTDQRRVEMMKHQLNELRRTTRRMNEQIKKLEEELTFLQENKNE
jgi:chromosome segregation ATPase